MRKVLLLVLASLLMMAACVSGLDTSDPDEIGTLAVVPAAYAGKSNPLGTEAEVAGAEVFETNCVMCHGPEGHGDGPAGVSLQPRPKNLAVLKESASDDYLFWRISEGKPGTSMLAWKSILTEDQIWQAVSFIRSLE
ncbi:MAG TPA: cytochrome c [Anaerolineales bacterium]|nr:cytochrome c [Anaerolineales bacterium]